MSNISPEQALSIQWLKEYNVKLIVPKNIVFKVRLLKFLWNSLIDIKSKTEKDTLVDSVCDGASVRSIQGYRKTNWKVESNSRLKIDETDWNKPFELNLISASTNEIKYTITFNEDGLKDLVPVTRDEVKTITFDKVKQRKAEIANNANKVETIKVESESEREEIARSIILDFATGHYDISSACLMHRVNKDDFYIWLFQSPVIRTMFDEARMILSVVMSVEMERKIDTLLLDRLNAGGSYSEKNTYQLATKKNSDNEEVNTEELILKGTERVFKETTINELAQIKKILQETEKLQPKPVDEFGSYTDSELNEMINKAEKEAKKRKG